MLVDSHVHIGRRFDKRLVEYIMGGQYRELADQLIIDMDKNGIDISITFGLLDLDTAYQAEIQKRYPDRIISCAWIDPHRRDAMDEWKNGVEVLGIRGLKLHGWWQQFALSDLDLLYPFVKVCEDNHLPVIAHSMGDNCMTTPLQLEELAKAFPAVNFVMAHGGNVWLPEEGILVAKRNKNVFLDTPYMSSYWIAKAVEELGADKVAMGSDYPWYYIESMLDHIHICVPKEEDREWVMGRTMATVFGLDWK